MIRGGEGKSEVEEKKKFQEQEEQKDKNVEFWLVGGVPLLVWAGGRGNSGQVKLISSYRGRLSLG